MSYLEVLLRDALGNSKKYTRRTQRRFDRAYSRSIDECMQLSRDSLGRDTGVLQQSP